MVIGHNTVLDMREIKICMGSACFSKGSSENLEFLKNYIKENNLENEIRLSGMLCENKCGEGPRLIIDEVEYKNVTVESLSEILTKIGSEA